MQPTLPALRRLSTLLIAFALALPLLAVQVIVNTEPARCGLNNGAAYAMATGGVPPYSYSWSNGASGSTIAALAPGDYIVTVTDGLNNTAQATATVSGLFELSTIDYFTFNMYQPDCMGQCTGIVQLDEASLMGVPPYNYQAPIIQYGGGIVGLVGLCASSTYNIMVTDANGCAGTLDPTGYVWAAAPAFITVQSSTPACQGEANGSMTILMDGQTASIMRVSRVGGGYVQYHYPAWNVPYTISGLPSGDYELISEVPGNGGFLCTLPFGGSVGEITQPCGSVSGRAFTDADQDCAFDANEYGLPYRVLTIDPGPMYAVTNENGQYIAGLAYDNYTLGQPLVEEAQLCPTNAPVPFTVDAGTPNVVIDLADSSYMPHDIGLFAWNHNARPGFYTYAAAWVMNTSAYPSGDLTVTMTYHPLLEGVVFEPVPSSQTTGSVTWQFSSMNPFSHVRVVVGGNVPADVNLLGYVLNYTINVTNSLAEVNTANNSTYVDVTITGSYDPNDKTARTSSGLSNSSYFLDQDEWIDYTIRFQNTGTAEATTVVVRDTLEMDLDPASLQIIGATHAFTPSFELGRVLKFTFENINLPDSNTNEPASHGSVHYRIRPRQDLALGDVISNTADIYFDFNPPVITEPSVLVAEMSTGQEQGQDQDQGHLALFPNPAQGSVMISAPSPMRAVQVFAADGRLLLEQQLSDRTAHLSIAALPTGNYAVAVRLADGSLLRERVINY
jgi:uncharacterized repeat protein (TIGR01451 family)